MDLPSSLPEPAWLDRFAMRIGLLMPSLLPIEALAYAQQMFAEAADLWPEEAAEIFSMELPPLDVGSPEQSPAEGSV